VIIGREATTVAALRSRGDAVAAINGSDSLSGWISLQSVWGGVPAAVRETGAHLESVRAVAAGAADIASIDAVSWDHFGRIEPALVAGLHVIGEGPRVPCLPLVTGWQHEQEVASLRAAFAAAVADPSAAEACATLRIRGFLPLDLADYLPLRTLLPTES
jgi:ABC-type phosphate/phosphonate transport system substrate-binding protein